MNVAVVGAGIMGSSAARSLAERGHQVTLFEQHELGHTLGSSHGRSRIVRKAYPDPYYTGIMNEAYPLWRELESASGLPILNEVGLMYFGAEDSADVQSVIAGLTALRVPHEVLRPLAVADRFPLLRLGEDEVAVFTPEAGWAHAANGIEANLELASASGAIIHAGTHATREALENAYDAFVVCAGPWIRQWIDLPVRTTVQTFAYVAAPAPVESPVWIESGPLGMYGFPSEPDDSSIKIGVHLLGREIDPAQPERAISAIDLGRIQEFAQRRLDLEGQIIESYGCLYTSTDNEDFRWGRLGGKGFWASACSGHGFKFGPWIGKKMADFVDGSDAPESHPRFSFPSAETSA